MKGLAFKCLEKLHELYKRNFVFSWDMDEDAMCEIYEELSNPILMFTRENCTLDRNSFCFKWEFTERLNNWLKSNHFPIATKSEINKYMREIYGESNRPSFVGGKAYRVWTGLRWKEKGDDASDSISNHFNHFNQLKKKVYIKRGSLKTPVNRLKQLNDENGVKND